MNAAGPMSAALETARSQLAACASYQAFVGVSPADEAAAAARTYLAALPPPADLNEYTREEWEAALRPFGMVYTSSAGGYTLTRSALYAVRDSGRLFVELEITIPTDYQPDPDTAAVDLTVDLESADRWILDQVGPNRPGFHGPVRPARQTRRPKPLDGHGAQPRTPRGAAGHRLLLLDPLGSPVGSYGVRSKE